MGSLLQKSTPNFHRSLSTSLKILSLILLSLLSSLFLNQEQESYVLAVCGIVLFIIIKTYLVSRSSEIYLVDYSCLKPPNYWRVPFSSFLEHAHMVLSLDQESVDFISKVFVSSGQSERTYLPPALHFIPTRPTHEEAVKEARLILFPVFEDLLSKTKLSPLDIDILIVNCSGFCPSPSLSSIIINRYSMREDIKSFNISGMGCSASALAVDMAQILLQAPVLHSKTEQR
ncbi:unnamed protein product [Lactuca virosa]|uniref:FAE domain-containing protein n=1 Tax=Lactuca virosa TaxID=75947 RepID=A0AAU9NM36_9ASTR|nr:unnamed protein product [Lactuca virosa]